MEFDKKNFDKISLPKPSQQNIPAIYWRKTMKHPPPDLSNFNSILTLIKTAKDRIVKTVNTEIIDLYWQIGKEISEKAQNGGWGKSVVEELSNQIAVNFGNMRGFSPQNIWRMKQFYETYKDS